MCEKSKGATSAVDCARKMHVVLADPNYFSLGHNEREHPWRVLDGVRSDCQTLSYLLKFALDHEGLTGANIMYVYGSTDTKCVSESPGAQETRTHGDHGQESIWVSDNGWNRYDACCVYSSTWFAGGLTFDETSGLKILQGWVGPPCTAVKQRWRWKDGEGSYHECGAPIPCPPCP